MMLQKRKKKSDGLAKVAAKDSIIKQMLLQL
jgi:hypothetical protein